MVSSSDGRVMQTLVQGFRVLQAFTASEPALTLGQVAYRTGLDSGAAFHLVQTLVMLGYVERISNWGSMRSCRTRNGFAFVRGLTTGRKR